MLQSSLQLLLMQLALWQFLATIHGTLFGLTVHSSAMTSVRTAMTSVRMPENCLESFASQLEDVLIIPTPLVYMLQSNDYNAISLSMLLEDGYHLGSADALIISSAPLAGRVWGGTLFASTPIDINALHEGSLSTDSIFVIHNRRSQFYSKEEELRICCHGGEHEMIRDRGGKGNLRENCSHHASLRTAAQAQQANNVGYCL
ncbi:hypothetical protein C8Q76DRAFT_698543 [Earliella scabrosa]|nr:hypothetical protein C8Q76DRAFT_698543 [Earliella scabrosa]